MAAAKNMTDAQRRKRAEKAAHARWSRTTTEERRRHAYRMRDGWESKLAADIDPDGSMDDRERSARVRQAQQAHYAGMAFNSLKSRRMRDL
ncbi:hypothetical protein ABH935_005352 [Catenulispora sp. GAS73]|uniref:hypothetical protein n=1 Tax=Catenulispora sp. GAS73 TaxID=3156269 RepID=UPI0035161790